MAETSERGDGSTGRNGESGAATRVRGGQTVGASIEIDAPVDVVWSVVNDPAVFPEAIDWVDEARIEDGEPLHEGSVYVERAKPGLRWGTYRWTITHWEPPRRSVHYHESGELEAELEVRCEPIDGDRTRYTQSMRYRAIPAFRPLGYVVERTAMKRAMRRDFERMILPNFKRIAERRAAEV